MMNWLQILDVENVGFVIYCMLIRLLTFHPETGWVSVASILLLHLSRAFWALCNMFFQSGAIICTNPMTEFALQFFQLAASASG